MSCTVERSVVALLTLCVAVKSEPREVFVSSSVKPSLRPEASALLIAPA